MNGEWDGGVFVWFRVVGGQRRGREGRENGRGDMEFISWNFGVFFMICDNENDNKFFLLVLRSSPVRDTTVPPACSLPLLIRNEET